MEHKLYPNIETSVNDIPLQIDPQNFRLSKINEIKTFLEKEIECRRKTINRYKRAFTCLTWTSNGCIGLCFGCEASSIALIATGVGTIPAIALESVGLAIGLLGVPISVANRKIIKKLVKHEEIYTLAISKLNSVNHLISKSLDDGKVTDHEYKTILDEHENYIQLKNSIRQRSINQHENINADELKKEYEKGKQEGKKEVMDKLLKSEQ